MKKILVAASLLLSVASFATPRHEKNERENEKGNHVPVSQIPQSILSAFWSSYPYAKNVQWEVEKEHGHIEYKVEFTLNGHKMKLRFS